jgi:hypothetical protein
VAIPSPTSVVTRNWKSLSSTPRSSRNLKLRGTAAWNAISRRRSKARTTTRPR